MKETEVGINFDYMKVSEMVLQPRHGPQEEREREVGQTQ